MGVWDNVSSGLLSFLEKPEALSLAAGLLSQGQGGFGRALGYGLEQYQGRGDKEETKKINRGTLDVNKGHLGVEQGKLGLEHSKLGLEVEKLQAARAQSQALKDLLSPVDFQNNIAEVAGNNAPSFNDNSAPINNGSQGTPNPGAILNLQDKIAEIAANNPGLLGQIANGARGPMSPNPTFQGAPPSLPLAPPMMPSYPQTNVLPSAIPQPLPNPQNVAAPPPATVPNNLMTAAGNSGLITLNNGMQVTPAQAKTAQAFLAIGKPEKAIEALTGDLTEPEVVKVARAIYGDITSPEARQFMHDVKLKPSTQVNIGDNTEKVKQQKIAELDVKTLGEAQDREKPSRELVRRAKETKQIAQEMRKRNLDPSRYWLTNQLDRNKIAASLGSKASQENVALVERLNKNAVYLMSEQVKSLGGRPNQFIEQQFAKAVPGQNVSLDTIETLSDALIPFGSEGQYEARFLRQYDKANGSLDGATETYEKWLETKPFAKVGKDGLLVPATDREITDSWKLWVDPDATYSRLLQKPIEEATRAEIEFMARYNQ